MDLPWLRPVVFLKGRKDMTSGEGGFRGAALGTVLFFPAGLPRLFSVSLRVIHCITDTLTSVWVSPCVIRWITDTLRSVSRGPFT